MNIFEHIDRFLMEKAFQKISGVFQRATGLTCFFLAKISIIVTWSTMSIAIIYWPTNIFLKVFMILVSLFYIPIAWFLIDLWDRKNEAFSAESGAMNPTVIKGSALRLLAWICAVAFFFLTEKMPQPYFITAKYIRISFVFVLIYLYFSACTPLPPGKSLIKMGVDWLSSLFGRTGPDSCPAETPPKS